MSSNLARKLYKSNNSDNQLNVSKSAIAKLSEVTADAKEFILGCKSDIELLAFLNKLNRVKFKKKTFGEVISNLYSNLVKKFPVFWQNSLKTTLDYIVAIVALMVFSPVMVLIAFLVKLTSVGPILYKQERVGKGGRFYMIFKFRSMKVDAEKLSGPMWAQENDSRLTSIGNFLRKSHLDELPQLFNVLKGEMSIIGPRPERPYFVGKLKDEVPMCLDRLDVKPGITGLAQVRNKYDETLQDVKKKVRYDILYIRKMCLLLDLKVLMWTVGVMFTGKGAR